MAEAAPAASYDARLKRALDALVYAPPGGPPSEAALDVFGTDDATQARPVRSVTWRGRLRLLARDRRLSDRRARGQTQCAQRLRRDLPRSAWRR